MSDNYPDGARFDPRAPWNEEEPPICAECGAEAMLIPGVLKGEMWIACECGHIEDLEP